MKTGETIDNGKSPDRMEKTMAGEGMLDEDIRASLQWIYQLHELGRESAEGINNADALRKMLEHIVNGFSASSGSLALVNETEDNLTIEAGIELPESAIGKKIAFGEGIIGSVAKQGRPTLLIGDLSSSKNTVSNSVERKSPRPASAICWPLLGGKKVIGVLCLNRKNDKPPFKEEDLQRGSLLVGLISLIVDNARLNCESKIRIDNLLLMNAALEDLNTKLEDAKVELASTQNRLQHLLVSSPAVIYSAKPDDYFIATFVSENILQLLGHQPCEFINDPKFWMQNIHPNDRHRIVRELDNQSAGHHRIHEYRFKHADGRYIWVRDEQKLITDESGASLEIVGYWSDITERKKTEQALVKEKQEQKELIEKLKDAQDQLLQSEKLASIGQLAAGVAHEINNPIGYIGSNLGTLSSYVDDLFKLIDASVALESKVPEGDPLLLDLKEKKSECNFDYLSTDLRELIDESKEGVSRVSQIVKDLKDFSRVDEAEWQWTGIHEGIESTLNIVKSELKYKAEVIREFGDLPDIECVPAQLNQVFMNLLVNAGHAIEESGTITIRTECNDRNIWVDVIDTGKGIDPDVLRKIFDPFFTTKPVGKGTGLGLALSYGIIEKHRGKIDVDSEVGVGTCFRVTLPIAQNQDSGI